MIAPSRVPLRAWHKLTTFWQENFQEQRCAVCHSPFQGMVENCASPALYPCPPSPRPAPLTAPSNRTSDNALPKPPLRAALAALCPACQKQVLPRLAGYCPHCGEIAALDTAPLSPCSQCLHSPPPWNQFSFHGVHQLALRQLLHRAKFAGDSAAQALLGQLLCATWLRFAQENTPVVPDILVPMPLHPLRLRHRGFNQCLEIARPLSKLLNVPLAPLALNRLVHSTPQTGLSRQARTQSTQAFAPTAQVYGKNIALIDDIMTTGTTIRHATTALLQGGAARVHIIVLARASLYHEVEEEWRTLKDGAAPTI